MYELSASLILFDFRLSAEELSARSGWQADSTTSPRTGGAILEIRSFGEGTLDAQIAALQARVVEPIGGWKPYNVALSAVAYYSDRHLEFSLSPESIGWLSGINAGMIADIFSEASNDADIDLTTVEVSLEKVAPTWVNAIRSLYHPVLRSDPLDLSTVGYPSGIQSTLNPASAMSRKLGQILRWLDFADRRIEDDCSGIAFRVVSEGQLGRPIIRLRSGHVHRVAQLGASMTFNISLR